MDRHSDVSEHVLHYLHANGITDVTGHWKYMGRTYNIGGSASTSASIDTVSEEDIGCAAAVLPKRARFTACSPAEDITMGTGGPTLAGVDYSVINSMSRFYLLARCIRERNRLDLNTTSERYEHCPTLTASEAVQILSGARSPWQLGAVWDYKSLEEHVLPGIAEAEPASRNRPLSTM